jgi:hypothetical protein
VGAAVIACVDTAPILKPSEHVLDFMASAIEPDVVRDLDLAVHFRRDAGGDTAIGQGGAKPVGIVSSVAKQGFGLGEGVDHEGRTFIVAHLPLAQQHDQRSTVAVAHRVKLRVQAPFGASDTSGNIPFFKRLAAVRWAFRWVASIIK